MEKLWNGNHVDDIYCRNATFLESSHTCCISSMNLIVLVWFLIRLKELLRAKLIECGWRDQLKALCKGKSASLLSLKLLHMFCGGFVKQHRCFFAEVIKEKGIENVTVEDLVAGVTPKGRGRLFFTIPHNFFLLKPFGCKRDEIMTIINNNSLVYHSPGA